MRVHIRERIHDYIVYCYSMGYSAEKVFNAAIAVFGEKNEKGIQDCLTRLVHASEPRKPSLTRSLTQFFAFNKQAV
ncbi:MAG TPA: hypothetical protein PKM99_06555 [Thermotogota bacterium]|nr:hypothetical protein [Thermotogota bacterium]NLZ14100.1 hypothetical protein [Thermotogaceae bacterium]MDD8040364.1 hypothetical protein [Thermotogota bacterium]MDD8052905.1 hypothetical protein [Thermotogota bacterium]HNR63700.1 hypothetical protein [Thermotogota bacterium]